MEARSFSQTRSGRNLPGGENVSIKHAIEKSAIKPVKSNEPNVLRASVINSGVLGYIIVGEGICLKFPKKAE